jgi:cell shape-determining protein MreC
MEQFLQKIVEIAEAIYPYLIAIIPTLTAIGTCTTICVAIMLKFRELRKDVKDKTDLTDARAEMKQLIAENRALKRRLDKLIEIQGKVKQYGQEDSDKEI